MRLGAGPGDQRGDRPQDGAHPPPQRPHQQGQRLAQARTQQGGSAKFNPVCNIYFELFGEFTQP